MERTHAGMTPLHIAVSSYFHPSLQVVKTLIDSGALVNAKNHDGLTPLQCAAMYPGDRTAEVVKILRDSGADLQEAMDILRDLSVCRNPAALELNDGDFDLWSSKLGSGGYGAVYAGELRDGTDVAVKVFRYEGQDEKGLRKEVDALVALASCQHIAVMYGYHIDKAGKMYLVMERLKHDLRRVIKSGKERNQQPCVELPSFYAWLLGAAKGLKHMHDNGYVHRDIKPENIMVGENNEAKLVDMGSAKKVGTVGHSHCFSETLGLAFGTGPYTAPGIIDCNTGTTSEAGSGTTLSVFGTGPYKAPEVLDSRGSPAADVYSLGRTAWVMIIGDPFYTQLCLPDGVQLPAGVMALIVSMTEDVALLRPEIDAVISTLEVHTSPGTQQGSQDVPVPGVYALATPSTGGGTCVTAQSSQSGGCYAVGRDPSDGTQSLGSRDVPHAGPSAFTRSDETAEPSAQCSVAQWRELRHQCHTQ
eukprot:TRINITY_DN1133_c0_g1_i6.p2 TRINITY_DN1133_c0_g1~~TRINITY_DN1133_c0_g1_i6.p2  ORF type:complete len:541 (+),score=83.37 TRINITY_DN1133_c0_g1_i6:204-1625(+)